MTTKIEWADATINPVVGCTKCSDGCRSCYAERFAARMAKNPNPKINGIEDNPKNREVHTYIYDDGRMLRFAPGIERPIIIDAKNNKVTFIPIEPEQNEGAKHDR